ncbi:MAG TPA: thioredoxin family protein [Methanosarcina sp.]|nr:thioredoxin family protein [Methanosarcina sp.]
MRQLVILLILLASVLFTAGCTKPDPVPQVNSSVVEVTQLEQVNTSLQNGPVLLKIGAEWCGPCQQMKPILNELTTDYKGKATIMSVDLDKSPELSDYFEVSSIPDCSVIVGIENRKYVYMQEDGNVTTDRFKARIIGYRDKQAFTNVLNLALQKENLNSK